MKKDTAHEIKRELEFEREVTGGGWYSSTEKERHEAYGDDFAYQDIWTVQVVYKKKQAEIRVPTALLDLIATRDLSVTLYLYGWSDHFSQNPDYRTCFVLDDGEFEKIEYTEEEQQRIELRKDISRTFDLEREVTETLAEHFDSVDEILTASREQLTDIPRIGDTRASNILHHYSDEAKQRLEGRKSGILVIPDENGVLRLPSEFENGEYTPDYSYVPGKAEDSDKG